MAHTRYYIKRDYEDDAKFEQVSKQEFISAERQAGFRSKYSDTECATGGFTGNGIIGKIRYDSENTDILVKNVDIDLLQKQYQYLSKQYPDGKNNMIEGIINLLEEMLSVADEDSEKNVKHKK